MRPGYKSFGPKFAMASSGAFFSRHCGRRGAGRDQFNERCLVMCQPKCSRHVTDFSFNRKHRNVHLTKVSRKTTKVEKTFLGGKSFASMQIICLP